MLTPRKISQPLALQWIARPHDIHVCVKTFRFDQLIGAKLSTEAVDYIVVVGERSIGGEAVAASSCGLYRSENVGLSSENVGENPTPRNPKVSSARLVRGGSVRT